MQNVILSPINTDVLIEKIAERTAELLNQNKKDECSSKDLLTRDETAALLHVNTATIWRWTKNGKLSPKGIGRRVYYAKSEVLDAISSLK